MLKGIDPPKNIFFLIVLFPNTSIILMANWLWMILEFKGAWNVWNEGHVKIRRCISPRWPLNFKGTH